MINRQVQTIFCDDIRHEVAGKVSYIGVYSGRLLVPTFPATLPKLCIAMTLVTPATTPFRKLSLRVLKDSEVLVQGALDEAKLIDLVDKTDEAPTSEHNDRVAMLQSYFVFSPFQVDAPCVIRVRVDTEEGELRGVGLRIEQASDDTDAK